MEETEQRAAKDGPQIKQDTWFALAIAAFLITVVIFGVAAMWVMSAPAPEMVQRAQSFTPFGAGMVAIVTFFTIAWRGVINTRQLEYQADQLEQVRRRQVDATDDANYAKLLQEGAKMLAETDKKPQIMAGVATLEILINEPKRRFAIEALDLLAAYVSEHYGEELLNSTNRAAIRGLQLGERLGMRSRLDGDFHRSAGNAAFWAYIPGMHGSTDVHRGIDQQSRSRES